jgi:AraC-like DNA-binding protein/CRP-like cAMP-binding protein
MDDIDLLLDYLAAIFPISDEFRKDLRRILKLRIIKKNTVLIKINKNAKKAWWLITGYVSASTIGPNGQETVTRIHQPEQIFTAFHSFFEDVLTIHKIQAITSIKVLEIKKEDFLILKKKYPEAMELATLIILQNTRTETERANLIQLPLNQKVAVLSRNYPIWDIPNKAGASLLQMPEQDYIEQKVILQKINSAASKDTQAPQFFKNKDEMAQAIKLYLQENYAVLGIDNTSKLAEHFNTTRKTATRNFLNVFGTTVYQFVLRLRMEQAKMLLSNNNRNISKIALSLGYKDATHFSHLYKKYFGHSPRIEMPNHEA